MTAVSSRCALAFLGLLLLGTPVLAGPWVVRVEAGTTDYSSRTFTGFMSDSTELRLDGGTGFGVAAEYRASPLIGVELSLSRIDIDADWNQVRFTPRPLPIASDSGTFSLQPLAAALLFHPARGRVDFYLGPQLAWVDYKIDLNGPPDRDSELAYGAKAGLEIGIGESPWSVGASYRYMDVQHEGAERDQYTGIRLHLISAALSYRIGDRP